MWKTVSAVRISAGQGGIETAPRRRNLFICLDVDTFWPAGHLYRAQIDKLQDQYVFGGADG